MKRHWVDFVTTIYGSILVEGDETPVEAAEYVRKSLEFRCSTEGEDGEINDSSITIIRATLEDEL